MVVFTLTGKRAEQRRTKKGKVTMADFRAFAREHNKAIAARQLGRR